MAGMRCLDLCLGVRNAVLAPSPRPWQTSKPQVPADSIPGLTCGNVVTWAGAWLRQRSDPSTGWPGRTGCCRSWLPEASGSLPGKSGAFLTVAGNAAERPARQRVRRHGNGENARDDGQPAHGTRTGNRIRADGNVR